MLNFLPALGGFNRQRGSACRLHALCPPAAGAWSWPRSTGRRGAKMPAAPRRPCLPIPAPAYTHTHHSCAQTDFPSLSFYLSLFPPSPVCSFPPSLPTSFPFRFYYFLSGALSFSGSCLVCVITFLPLFFLPSVPSSPLLLTLLSL